MPKEWTISSSKLKTYMECPAQYYWRYVAKKPDDPKSASLKLTKTSDASTDSPVVKQDMRIEQEPSAIFDSGKLVHRVLHLAAEKRAANKSCDKKATKKELLSLLEAVACEPPTDDFYRPMTISPEVIESAAKVLALCWKTIDFPFTIKAEHKFSESIGPVEDDRGNVVIEDVKLNGIIDRIDRLPNGRIKIVDYKSGWSVMSRSEAELDPQINFYLVVGKLIFPKSEIDMELRYLNRGIRLGPIHYTDARKDWLLNGYVKPIVARMATWSKFPETPGSPQCYSCPRKSECASFASMVKGTLGPVTADMGLNLALYERLGDIEKNVEKLKDQIKPFINAAVEKADDGEIFAGNHRAQIVFRNSTAYHDMRGTSLAAAKAIVDAKRPSVQAELVIPDDISALKAGYARLVDENTKLKAIAMEATVAFEVASKIGKAQAGLVNDFVEGLPEDVTVQVAQAIGHTSTNSGFYMLEVERITIPFHDRTPNQADVEEADRQSKLRKLIPEGSKPIFDDSHETKDVEAVVVETQKAIAESPKAIAVAEPPKAIAMTQPISAAQAETMELFAPPELTKPARVAEVAAEPTEAPAAKTASWGQAGCKACGGSGIASRGGPCRPCVANAEKVGV